MKDYKIDDGAFSDTIKILEETDSNHAKNVNAATEQLLANTVSNKKEIDVLDQQQENFYQPRGEFTGNIDDLYKPEDTGVYWVIKASASGTMPSQEASPDYFHLIVSNSKTTTTVQIAVVWMGDNGAPYVHVRNYINKIWSPWRNLQEAERATKDYYGRVIDSTYLPKAGGTISSHLAVQGILTVGSEIRFGSDSSGWIRDVMALNSYKGISMGAGKYGFELYDCCNHMVPLTDCMILGSPIFGKRIGSIYTQGGTLTGSDRHIKENIEPLAGNDKYLELFDRV
ncbi:MAG: pyocin knob domain-containing protein, partial [Roseburia sp.]|nr:pyocin knob domain-containing protein [Roseburia sp.]